MDSLLVLIGPAQSYDLTRKEKGILQPKQKINVTSPRPLKGTDQEKAMLLGVMIHASLSRKDRANLHIYVEVFVFPNW